MGDTDFPIAMGGGFGGSPLQPIDPDYRDKMLQPGTTPPGGFKEFLQQYLPKVPGTQKPTGYFREDLSGERSYAQSGTDIPSFQVGQSYGQQEGGPIYGQTVAQGIPVGQDPIFPMGQEEFSDYVRGRMEQRNPPNQPIPADILRRIQGVRAKYGFGSA